MIVGLALFVACVPATDSPVENPNPNLADHRIYRTFEFGRTAEIVDIGIQPLWIPTSLVAEMMRHDRILTRRLEARNIRLRFHPFLKGADVNFFLERGDLEVGIGGDMPALTAAARSNVLVATLIQQGMCSIVARKQMLLTGLRGMRVAYGFGSNAHYALLDSLRTAGMTEDDVRMIPIDVSEMPQALNRGDIEAFVAWEPTPTIAHIAYPDQVAIHRSLCSGYLYFAVPFATEHRDVVDEIVAGAFRALHRLQGDSHAIVQACEWASRAAATFDINALALPAAQCEALARDDILGVSGLPSIPSTMRADGGPLHKELEFLQQLGQIPRSVQWSTVRRRFDPSIGERVIANAITYELFASDTAATTDEDDVR